MRYRLTFWLILCSLPALPQKSMVTGTANAYKGVEIVFYEYSEMIFNTPEEVFRFLPDDNGFFYAEFMLDETKYLFTDYGACHYYFYAEPGKVFKLFMPDPLIKTPEQQANPFFIPSPVHLNVQEDGDAIPGCTTLNDAILTYDIEFEPFYSKQVVRYYSPVQSKEKLDSFIIASDIPEKVCDAAYYKSYTRHKQGMLEFTVSQFNMAELIKEYFFAKPLLFSNPAWWELFEKVYDRYFSFLSHQQDFADLYKYMNTADYTSLDNLLQKDPGLQNDTLRGLILIRELHHEFYDGSFPKPVITALLDSVALRSVSAMCREIAHSVKFKITRLQPGSVSPPFHLTEATGTLLSSENLRGRYIYLGFCTPHSLDCMKEFEYLKHLDNMFKKYLTIITVFDDVPVSELNTIKQQFNYTWLFTSNQEKGAVYDEYEVKATPQFFLIAPDGSMLKSPAGLPSEGFEREFIAILRERGDL